MIIAIIKVLDTNDKVKVFLASLLVESLANSDL